MKKLFQERPTQPPNPDGSTGQPGPPNSPPLYHYHKSPECLAPFKADCILFFVLCSLFFVLYHYHKSPECLAPFKAILLHLDHQPCHQNASVGLAFGGRPDLHGQLMGWALDGFGIYSYQVNYDADDTYILQRTLVERHQWLMSVEATLVPLTQER